MTKVNDYELAILMDRVQHRLDEQEKNISALEGEIEKLRRDVTEPLKKGAYFRDIGNDISKVAVKMLMKEYDGLSGDVNFDLYEGNGTVEYVLRIKLTR